MVMVMPLPITTSEPKRHYVAIAGAVAEIHRLEASSPWKDRRDVDVTSLKKLLCQALQLVSSLWSRPGVHEQILQGRTVVAIGTALGPEDSMFWIVTAQCQLIQASRDIRRRDIRRRDITCKNTKSL
jgi:hypothetical protein